MKFINLIVTFNYYHYETVVYVIGEHNYVHNISEKILFRVSLKVIFVDK